MMPGRYQEELVSSAKEKGHVYLSTSTRMHLEMDEADKTSAFRRVFRPLISVDASCVLYAQERSLPSFNRVQPHFAFRHGKHVSREGWTASLDCVDYWISSQPGKGTVLIASNCSRDQIDAAIAECYDPHVMANIGAVTSKSALKAGIATAERDEHSAVILLSPGFATAILFLCVKGDRARNLIELVCSRCRYSEHFQRSLAGA